MQNFSYDKEHFAASAKEEVTFDYTFRLAPSLDPGHWRVALTVFYEVGPALFADTFFNETVTLKAASSPSLAYFFLFSAIAAAAAYFFLDGAKVFGAEEKKQQITEDEDKPKAPTDDIDDSWTAHLDPAASKKKTTKKTPTKANKKSK